MTQDGVWLQILATLICESAGVLKILAPQYGAVFMDTQAQWRLFGPPNLYPCWDPIFMGQNAKFYVDLRLFCRPEKIKLKLGIFTRFSYIEEQW